MIPGGGFTPSRREGAPLLVGGVLAGGVSKAGFWLLPLFEHQPLPPTSLEIFTGEFGSTKIDQKRPKSIKIDQKRSKSTAKPPPPFFTGAFCEVHGEGRQRSSHLRGQDGKAPSPNVPKLRRLGFWLFFFGGVQNQVFVHVRERERERVVPDPPYTKTAATIALNQFMLWVVVVWTGPGFIGCSDCLTRRAGKFLGWAAPTAVQKPLKGVQSLPEAWGCHLV